MSRENSRVENQLSLLRRNQIDVECERRLRRNKEVDDLIQNIGDPRIAERLRIYRLVEEKFLAVEQQVTTILNNKTISFHFICIKTAQIKIVVILQHFMRLLLRA